MQWALSLVDRTISRHKETCGSNPGELPDLFIFSRQCMYACRHVRAKAVAPQVYVIKITRCLKRDAELRLHTL